MLRKTNVLAVIVTLAMFGFAAFLVGRQSAAPLNPEAFAVCSLSMEQVVESGLGDVYNFTEITNFTEPKLYYLTHYTVSEDSIQSPVYETVPADLRDEQTAADQQSEAWQIFTRLIPAEHRQMVTQFNVFTDGYSNTLAAVDQSKQNNAEWMLEVDIADLEDREALVFTLVHEYAHLLTLNASQVVPDADLVNDPYNRELQKEKAATCPNYFPGNGCSRPESYIHAFYNRFWLSIADEWAQADALQYEDDLLYYNALYSFYKTHQDQFVGDYAVTHPAEDIAESFTHFVFTPKPTGSSIKDQKIRFFYEYPELVQLREDILNGTCQLNNPN